MENEGGQIEQEWFRVEKRKLDSTRGITVCRLVRRGELWGEEEEMGSVELYAPATGFKPV